MSITMSLGSLIVQAILAQTHGAVPESGHYTVETAGRVISVQVQNPDHNTDWTYYYQVTGYTGGASGLSSGLPSVAHAVPGHTGTGSHKTAIVGGVVPQRGVRGPIKISKTSGEALPTVVGQMVWHPSKHGKPGWLELVAIRTKTLPPHMSKRGHWVPYTMSIPVKVYAWIPA